MSRILIRANRVMTLRDHDDVIRKGAVIVEEGKIKAVGSYRELSEYGPFDEELGSLAHDIVMPGLVSAHHHPGNNIRDGIEDDPLELWLPVIFGSYRAEMTEEENYLRSLWSTLELQRSGVTTVVDFHPPNSYLPRWGIPSCIQAHLDAGMRVTFGVSVRDQNFYVYGDHASFLDRLPKRQRVWVEGYMKPPDHNEYFRLFDGIFDEFNGRDDRVRIFLMPAGPQTASDGLLRRIKEKAAEVRTGIQLHVDESKYQMMCGPKLYGKTLTGHLKEIGFLGPEVSFAHYVWPTEDDIRIVADTGTGVSHNPTQNFKLWSGIAPVYRMRQLGVRFGIGTDGSSFNDDNDIWTELRLGWFLARPPSINSEKILPREWVSRCVQDGNRIAMQGNLGSLAEGKTADLILVDGRKIFKDPDTHPDLDPWLVLLHRTQGIRDVHTVMIGGRIVRRKGKSVVVDEIDIGRRFRKLLKKRYQRVRKDKPFFAPILESVRENFQKWEEESDVPPPDIHRYNQV